MLKRILVGLGGGEYAASAVAQAVELARQHRAEVTGISVLDEARLTNVGPMPIGVAALGRELSHSRLEKAQDEIERTTTDFLQVCRGAGVSHRLLKEEGDPVEQMIQQARYHDLMVIGLRSLFEFNIVPDPHDAIVKLVQGGVRPMLAVSRELRPVGKVLIAFSGSMESAKAMKHFVQMRLWPGAKLRVVTFGRPLEEGAALVGDAGDYCRAHGFEVEEDFVSDSPKSRLLPYATDWGADLIVVGNSAKSLLTRRVFGETVLQVIRDSDLPLFLSQ